MLGSFFCYSLLCVNHIDGEERNDCLTLIVCLMSCDSYCYVALAGWSAVCGFCGC